MSSYLLVKPISPASSEYGPWPEPNTSQMYIIVVAVLLFVCVAAALLVRAYMKWSIVWCTSPVRMDGKVVVVTGGNAGIGYQTAKELAERGAKVILACRSEERGLQARDTLIEVTGNRNIEYRQLDLCSLDSVRQFAQQLIAAEPRLHVLINNAGMHGGGERATADGLVLGAQVNYFGPFLLTLLLLPALRAARGRVVNVNSLCHWLGELKLDKFNQVDAYLANSVYANSKLAQMIFTKELSRRLVVAAEGVTVNALHPGVISTNIIARSRPLHTRLFFACWCWLCHRTVEEGAQTSVYLAVAEEVEDCSGEYFVDCRPALTHWKVRDRELALRLWDYSQDLVKCVGVLPPSGHSAKRSTNGSYKSL